MMKIGDKYTVELEGLAIVGIVSSAREGSPYFRGWEIHSNPYKGNLISFSETTRNENSQVIRLIPDVPAPQEKAEPPSRSHVHLSQLGEGPHQPGEGDNFVARGIAEAGAAVERTAGLDAVPTEIARNTD